MKSIRSCSSSLAGIRKQVVITRNRNLYAKRAD